jgi:hypothetical protein
MDIYQPGIYKITCVPTGKFYIGSAVSMGKRWAVHRNSLRDKKRACPRLQNAWNKYGEDAFVFEALLACEVEDLIRFEQLMLDTLRPELNVLPTAGSMLGMRWSEEVNAKKQARHRVHTVNGFTDSIRGLARRFGVIGERVACLRVQRGWPVEDAVTKPPETKQISGTKAAATHKRNGTHPSQHLYTAFGETSMLRDLVTKYSQMSYTTVRARIRRGDTVEAALIQPRKR